MESIPLKAVFGTLFPTPQFSLGIFVSEIFGRNVHIWNYFVTRQGIKGPTKPSKNCGTAQMRSTSQKVPCDCLGHTVIESPNKHGYWLVAQLENKEILLIGV